MIGNKGNLEKLVKQGEGHQLEFKLKTNHPEKIIREIVAFANSSGGKLLIGVNDHAELIGLPYIEEDEFTLVQAIEKSITPLVSYRIERIKLSREKSLLIFHIDESLVKPHYIDSLSVYVRNADKTIQASKEIREILKGQRKNRNLRFSFGKKEMVLMEYLEIHKKTSLDQFMEMAEISKKQASRTLILLVLTNVLTYKAREKEDWFFLAN